MADIFGVYSEVRFTNRLLQLPTSRSFFLFGARNTGKSTLLEHSWNSEECLWLDLLDPSLEEKYSRNIMSFQQEVLALNDHQRYVIIDEVQKIPKLLDLVHQLIEKTNKIFIMTGSSARKLKHSGANLLAGRAFVHHLHPFTHIEIGEQFDLDVTLSWGALPSVVHDLPSDQEKTHFLQAYTQTYLKEEIWLEHFIRKIEPFRKFLEVSAQCNGQTLNFSNIARDVGVDDKTIKQYFSLLEDTLMGFMLEPYHGSFRKRLHSKPKFYYFDTGVCRALSRLLSVPVQRGTSYYGQLFEHYIILECIRLASYYFPEYRFSYVKTRDDVEIDLVVERPGQKLLCIEIKSSSDVREEQLSSFARLVGDIPNAEGVCFSQDRFAKQVGDVLVMPWRAALTKYFATKT